MHRGNKLPPQTVKAQEKPLFQITGSTNFLLSISDVQEAGQTHILPSGNSRSMNMTLALN